MVDESHCFLRRFRVCNAATLRTSATLTSDLCRKVRRRIEAAPLTRRGSNVMSRYCRRLISLSNATPVVISGLCKGRLAASICYTPRNS